MIDADRSGEAAEAIARHARRLHLGRVARLFWQRHERRANQMGLTPAQMHALSVVRCNEGRSQRSTAETIDLLIIGDEN